MLAKPFYIFKPFGRFFVPLLFLLLIEGCGGGGDSKGPAAPVDSDPAFSMPLPKGMWAPLPDSDLVMTAQAVIDPGTAGERTIDLTVDLSTNRVSGAIERVPAGPRTVEIRYFINQVQVAAVTLSVDVVPGKNTPAEIAPAAIRYIEAVSDTLFVADAADPSIKMFDRYSTLPGGRVSTAPTRTLRGENTGIVGPSSGSLFVDSIGGRLYFADAADNSVSVWNNAATVNGDTPPDRVLKGPGTRLLKPTGIAVDPFRDRLYVVNSNGEILIWNLSSLEGEIPPLAVLTGSLFAGDHPVFLDVKRDTLYVANGREISVFEKLSGLTGDIQNVTPVPTIRIAGEGLSQPGLVLDYSQNLLFISSRDPNGTIYRVAEASTASEEVVPAATLAGPETGLDQTAAVTLAGNVFMALNVAGTEIRVWHQADQKDGDRSPTQILELDPNASPEALFYVATQNGERDQAEHVLTVQKSGDGGVTSDLPGINCGTTCTTPFPTGSQVTLTAVAETGSTFAGFSGDCTSATTSCTFTLEADSVVTVAFSDTQAPAAPSNLIASVASATQIDLSWIFSIDNVGTSGYWIERCEGTGCTDFSRVNTSLTTDTSFSDTGLESGAVYRYRVQGEDASGNLSPFSNIATASTLDTIAPSMPTNLTATPAANGTQINLSWTASTDNVGVSGYWIESCQGAACTNFARVAGALMSATSFINTNLTSAVTYRYRIQAEDAAGNPSPYSTIVNATTPDTVAPTRPTGLTATVVSGTQINLSWNPSTDNVGVTHYQVQRCPGTTSCISSFTSIGTPNGTSFNDTGLINGTSYRYRVRAVDAAGRQSSFSTVVTATTTDTAAPTAPTNLTVTVASGTQINLSWIASTDNVGVTGYWIERCTGVACTNFARVNTSLVANTTFSNTGLTPATTYRYQVQAADAGGNVSAYSNIAVATTPDTVSPTAPSNLAAAASGSSQIDLSWTASTDNVGVSGYWIERCQGAGCSSTPSNFAPVNTVLVTSNSYNDSGLASGTSYSYRVRAEDAAGNRSNYSNVASTTTAVQITVTKSGTGIGAVTSTPAGIFCGEECSGTFEFNTRVILSAKPDLLSIPPSQFSGWGGDCASAGTNETCELDMNSNKSVTAQFDEVLGP